MATCAFLGALCLFVALRNTTYALPNLPTKVSALERAIHPDSSSVRLALPRDDTCRRLPLRVLALGASITHGQGSSNGNGYRKRLQDMFQQRAGIVVDMVGTVSSGKMKDNQNEGHPGALVHEVAMYAEQDLRFQPNLVLVNVGTNDALKNPPQYPLESINQQMDTLLDRLFDQIHCVTIVLSTLLPNANPTVDHRISTIVNPKYRAIAEARRRKGQRIVLADMYPNVSKDHLGPDGIHPTDTGYQDMASVWYKSVEEGGGKRHAKALGLPGMHVRGWRTRQDARAPCALPQDPRGLSSMATSTTCTTIQPGRRPRIYCGPDRRSRGL
ncbi:GDSL-like lipase acylhydrolase [Paraphaeosphaeria sporulosa]